MLSMEKKSAPRQKKMKVKKGRAGRGKITGGFATVYDKTLAGQEDAEYTTLVFETTSAFTSTGGAASYLQIKGNSIYRPYPSVLSSPAGYARMYTQYLVAQVIEAKCEVQCWSGVSGQDEPFRIIVLPCTSQAYTIYSAFTNVSSLAGVPHAKQSIFSPGGKIPRVTASATTSSLIYGESKIDESAEATQTNYVAATGTDPGNIWYFLVGYQNFAGTTTTNQQAQVRLTYRVKWFKPVATAEQAITCDYFGNEMVDAQVLRRILRAQGQHDSKSTTTSEQQEEKKLLDPPPPGARAVVASETGGLGLGLDTEPSDEQLYRKFLAFIKGN